MRFLVWFVVFIGLLASGVAVAEPTPTSPRQCGNDDVRPPLAKPKFYLELDPTTRWQPKGGLVRFYVRNAGFATQSNAINVCFRWQGLKGKHWVEGRELHLEKTEDTRVTYTVRVPATDWAEHGEEPVARDFYFAKISDMRVIASDNAQGEKPFILDEALRVGITSVQLSFLFTSAFLGLTLFLLYRVGLRRRVPGQNWAIKLITTRGGFASLSQFQIMLWTFVVGVSSIYVMTLSGNLLDINAQMLGLLGIAGATAVISAVQSSQADRAVPANPSLPGAIGNVTATEVGPDSVRLSWAPPAYGGVVGAYVVEVTPTGGTARTITASLATPGILAVGLDPNLLHIFSARAVNALGQGPAASATVTTGAIGPHVLPKPVPPKVRPYPHLPPIELSWPAVTGASTYEVQYRRRDSDEPWSSQSTASLALVLTDVFGGSAYQIRIVAGDAAGGRSPPSDITISPSGPRSPRWSDLVVVAGRGEEIDVTRVQMLFFTMVTAIFVSLNVLVHQVIPGIPEGFLTLMGISNGVYLTAKFVPKP